MPNRTGITHGATSKAVTLTCFWARPLLLAGLALNFLSQADAAIINAASVSFADVASAIALASDGDTVVVPGGTVSWTSILLVTKGITLQGAGNDATVILDDVPRTLANEAGSIIAISSTPTQSFRLTGFTFRNGSLTTTGSGTIRLSGTSTVPSVRVDHCHFDSLHCDSDIQIFGWLYGVIDHCVFDMSQATGAVTVSHNSWGNQPSGWGSWADPPYFGSEKFIFIEDCVINNHSTAPNAGFIDGPHGGRFVARHNAFNNMSEFYHGSDSGAGGANLRGTRAVEMYDNMFASSIQISGGYSRGGSLLWHDNQYIYTGPSGGTNGGMSMKIYRLSQGVTTPDAGSWTVANGQSTWDRNVTESDGVTNVNGHSPYRFLTGTAAGSVTVSSDGQTMVFSVSSASPALPLTPNQWAGYSVTNTKAGSVKGAKALTGLASYIVSNTTNTITCVFGAIADSRLDFNAKDTFAIYKVLNVLDAPGMGQDGTPLTGSPPLAGPPAPLNQAIEGCFGWNNTQRNGNGPTVNLPWQHDDTADPLREGINFFNRAPQSGDLIYPYTPYVYPHPLVGSLLGPTNLRVVN